MMTKKEAMRRMKEAGEAGNLIESGFIAHVDYYAPNGISDAQRMCMRHAFFYGVRHTLDLIILARDALEEGAVTEEHCETLLETLYDELDRFGEATKSWIMSMIQGVSKH